MIQYAFSFLMLVISTVTYCIYLDRHHYYDRKRVLIDEYKIQDQLDHLPFDDTRSVRIKQMWKDKELIEPFNDTHYVTGYYFFTVLITIGNIVVCSVAEYRLTKSVLGIVWMISIPTIIIVAIWVLFVSFARKYRHLYIDSIEHLHDTISADDIDYYSIERNMTDVIQGEIRDKEKVNRYYSAVGIILLISVLTLATRFFYKTEYEIEEDQAKIEESYQKGYEDGYADGVSDQ